MLQMYTHTALPSTLRTCIHAGCTTHGPVVLCCPADLLCVCAAHSRRQVAGPACVCSAHQGRRWQPHAWCGTACAPFLLPHTVAARQCCQYHQAAAACSAHMRPRQCTALKCKLDFSSLSLSLTQTHTPARALDAIRCPHKGPWCKGRAEWRG